MIQSYNYANEYVTAVIVSEDFGVTWPKKLIIDRSPEPLYDPLIKSDGPTVAIAWLVGGSAWLTTSTDSGDSWTLPVELRAPDGVDVGSMDLAITGTSVAALLGTGSAESAALHLCEVGL